MRINGTNQIFSASTLRPSSAQSFSWKQGLSTIKSISDKYAPYPKFPTPLASIFRNGMVGLTIPGLLLSFTKLAILGIVLSSLGAVCSLTFLILAGIWRDQADKSEKIDDLLDKFQTEEVRAPYIEQLLEEGIHDLVLTMKDTEMNFAHLSAVERNVALLDKLAQYPELFLENSSKGLSAVQYVATDKETEALFHPVFKSQWEIQTEQNPKASRIALAAQPTKRLIRLMEENPQITFTLDEIMGALKIEGARDLKEKLFFFAEKLKVDFTPHFASCPNCPLKPVYEVAVLAPRAMKLILHARNKGHTLLSQLPLEVLRDEIWPWVINKKKG